MTDPVIAALNAMPQEHDPSTGLPVTVIYRYPTDAESAALKAALVAVLMAGCEEAP